jgi:hypothetical protein
MGEEKQQEAVASLGLMHLDAETSLAPVPPLRVVAAEKMVLAKTISPRFHDFAGRPAQVRVPSPQPVPCLHRYEVCGVMG